MNKEEEKPVENPSNSEGNKEEKEESQTTSLAKANDNAAETGVEKEDASKTEENAAVAESEDDWETEEDTQEVQSDEEDEKHEEEQELPDYAEYTPEKLMEATRKLLKNEQVQDIKEHFEAIRKYMLKQLNEERDEKLKQFLEEGGNKIDFEYRQPLRQQFKELYGEYRKRRKKYFEELRERLEHNLEVKKNLIEKLKELTQKEESIGDTFKEFNAIQEEWRNTGPVPRSESGNLWRTYHHHVENFYEYIKINKELRDLDYQKNRKKKEELTRQAEELTKENDVPKAFKELQKLHRQWKYTGPVEPVQREPMWERFSELTKTIHENREKHFEKLQARRDEQIAEKKKIIEAIKQVPTDHKRHRDWQEAIKKVEELREQFRKIGRLNHLENDSVFDDYRQANKEFNHHKNEFYKELKKDHQENLKKKQELLGIAEELKDSDDWKNTVNEMKRIQAEWKKIGHVPKNQSDKIWKQFRAACNHFFDRLTERNKELDQAREGNLKEKQKVLEELKNLETDKNDQKGSIQKIKAVIEKWKKLGPVPRDKQKIEKEFNQQLDAKFQAVDLDREESQRIRYQNKMENIAEQGGAQKLNKERNAVAQKLDEAQKELDQLQTNMNFFRHSDPNNPLVKEAQKNIDKQEEQVADLEKQHKMLNIKIRELQKPSEAEKKEEQEGTEEESSNDK